MVGKRLAKLRKGKGLTQEELASCLSVSKYSITMYETNRKTPQETTMIAIAKYFNVSLDYLVGLTDELYSYQRDKRYILKVSKNVHPVVVDTLSEFVDFVNCKFTEQNSTGDEN